jgi:hypothetical protein
MISALLGPHVVGSSAHPTRQSKEAVLADPVGEGVGELSQLDGVVAQVLAKLGLKGGHDFFLWQGFTETLGLSK